MSIATHRVEQDMQLMKRSGYALSAIADHLFDAGERLEDLIEQRSASSAKE